MTIDDSKVLAMVHALALITVAKSFAKK